MRVVVFIVASLSIMGFPLLAGFITKNWFKYDIPCGAKIIFAATTLLACIFMHDMFWSIVFL